MTDKLPLEEVEVNYQLVRIRQMIESEIEDLRAALEIRLNRIERTCEDIRLRQDNQRMLNDLGEFQAQASKADAVIAKISVLQQIVQRLS